jgi:hypothetical protein
MAMARKNCSVAASSRSAAAKESRLIVAEEEGLQQLFGAKL